MNLIHMNLTEALKWADTFGPIQSEPPGGDSPALVTLAAAVRQWKDCAETLAEELSAFSTQHGCHCGHPACKVCRETRDAEKALERFQQLKAP